MYNQFRPGLMATEALLRDNQPRSGVMASEAIGPDAQVRPSPIDRLVVALFRIGRDRSELRLAGSR